MSLTKQLHIHSSMAFLALLVALVWLPGLTARAQGLEDKIEKDQRIVILPGVIPPDFTAVDLDGETFTLSEMQGVMPVVIDFWATWCPPCRAEIPHLNRFAALHGEEVLMIGISVDRPNEEEGETVEESCRKVRDFSEDQELVYRLIHDPSGEIKNSYGVTGIPHLFVIDIDGTLVTSHLGYSEDMDIVAELEEELGL